MELSDERVEVAALERHLLAGLSSNDYDRNCDDEVLYDASFGELEDNFMKYQVAHWILLSVLLILAWGVGILMLLYLPIRIYNCRREFRSRKLYLTPHAIVYKAVVDQNLNSRNLNFRRKLSLSDDQHNTKLNPVAGAWVLEKLDEVEISVKLETSLFL